MASSQNNDLKFPIFPFPTPPPRPSIPPPSPPHSSPPPAPEPPRPLVPPPSPPPSSPPPAPKPPRPLVPPPSPHPHVKPPPHPLPPPSPPHFSPPPAPKPPRPPILPPHPISPPPPPAPGHNSAVIIVVFVSLGGLFFLAFLSVALFCFIKKQKKRTDEKIEIINFDEHKKVQEAIVPGPHGEQVKILTIEEDIHIDEEITKTEKLMHGSHIKSANHHPQAIEVAESSQSTQAKDLI